MDTISHSLCGAAIARAGFEQKLGGRTALIVGVIAANFADLDIIGMPLFGTDHYLLWHGGITHSILALIVLPPLLAFAVNRVTHAPFRPLVALCYIAYASHLVLDVLTSWGTMLLLPFDETRFSLHWLYTVDLFFWCILSLPFWLNRLLGEPALIAKSSLFALAIYILVCGGLHAAAITEVKVSASKKGLIAQRVAAYPSPFVPVFWTGVADDGTFLHQGAVQVPVGFESRLTRQRPKNFAHPAVQAVLKEPLAERFISWWAHSPIAKVYCLSSGYRVVLRDVRFESPWLDSSGFRLAWDVEYRAATEQYAVLSHRWLNQWAADTLSDGECAFRMEVDMSRSTGTKLPEK